MMYLLEDDTLLCVECWDDEGGDYCYRPAHKQIYATVEAGSCSLCLTTVKQVELSVCGD